MLRGSWPQQERTTKTSMILKHNRRGGIKDFIEKQCREDERDGGSSRRQCKKNKKEEEECERG
jgi:hypothetical protein